MVRACHTTHAAVWRGKSQITPLRQRTLNNGVEDGSWEDMISGYQIWIPLCTHRLGVYSLGVYRSRATRFRSRYAFTGCGSTVWGSTDLGLPDLDPVMHSPAGGLQSGGLQSRGLQSGGLQSEGLQISDYQIWIPLCTHWNGCERFCQLTIWSTTYLERFSSVV